VLPFSGVEFGIGWGGGAASDAQEGPKSVEWIESSVDPKGEFVQVGLKVLMADTMMGTE
jgi:hypothetical protein